MDMDHMCEHCGGWTDHKTEDCPDNPRVFDSSRYTGSPSIRSDEITWRWYGETASPTEQGKMVWIPSCWRRPTLQEARDLLTDDRFIASGMLRTNLKLIRETTTFIEVEEANDKMSLKKGARI